MAVDDLASLPLAAQARPVATPVIRTHGRAPLAAINKYKFYYLLAVPGLLYFIIFHYIPMFGIIIAFKDISPFGGVAGILDAPWVGLKHFERFINSVFFWNIMSNTIIIRVYKLAIGFPAPIILALLLNELRILWFKRIVQTISYLPHFISWVVVAGLSYALMSQEVGLINDVIKSAGGEPIAFLRDPKYFRSVLVATATWKGIGWSSIIYLAAMTSIDPAQYEAAALDGASKLQRAWHITLPGIALVIVIQLIFAVGALLNAGFEQILLMYSPVVYNVADIIDTYVYRVGLLSMEYSFAAAVGLFKSVIALILLLLTNKAAHRLGYPGIW
jgi:putative aldouronate transport system permease protein